MDRATTYRTEIGRTYDFLKAQRYALYGLGRLGADVLGGGTPPTVVSGFAATPTAPATLSINLGAGNIYAFAAVDATAYGTLAADLTSILQQGFAPAAVLTLTTAGLSSGQSQFALVEVTFQQVDVVPADDASGGVLPYVNPLNAQAPWSGPNNTSQVQNSARTGQATVRIAYGPVAPTGSEVPPGVDAGYVPLYLIDLNFGQTQILASQIKVAGPLASAGYQQAPFLAGLLNQHHLGVAGSAPKIDLTAEVQKVLPLANLPATDTTGLLPTIRFGTFTTPNGNVAGAQGDLWLNITTGILWACLVTGGSSGTGAAVWAAVSGSTPPFANSALSGPLLNGVLPGTGIAVTIPPSGGIFAQTVSANNVPNSVLAGPILGSVAAGPGVTVTSVPTGGIGAQTISATDLGHLFGTTGHIVFPGGFIIQWIETGNDWGAGVNESVKTYNWDISFPNRCLVAGVSMQVDGWTGTTDIWFQTVSWTQTQVTVAEQYPGGGASSNYGNPRAVIFAFGF
jgi:hypothetical protein